MKALHSASLLSPPSGIVNQMRWEQYAAKSLGIDWSVKIFCPKGAMKAEKIVQESVHITSETPSGLKKLYKWAALRKEYYEWLLSVEHEYDVFLLRYSVHDPFQLWFLSRCKKPVYLVHHTLEVTELATAGGASGPIRAGLEWLIGRYAIRKATGLVGVTEEIIKYQKDRASVPNKRTHLYPNGIYLKDTPVCDRREVVPELLFVAGSFSPWHGLDLLLDSIKSSEDEFKLHLVGYVSDNYLNQINNDTRVILHGRKNNKEIREISEKCWVGLSSFALHRNKMKQACTLKVREYLMMGLPVYASYDEVFDNDFKFFVNSKPDISNILSYCNDIKGVSRDIVREKSEDYIDKEALLKSLSRFLLS